jgi:hypothetical protein
MPEPITWTCAECGQLIADGEGALGIDPNSARPEMEPDEHGDYVINVAEDLAHYQPPAPWWPLHYACTRHGHPTEDGEEYFDLRFTYAIEIHRLRTVGQLLRWQLHVPEKTWVRGTNWHEVISAAADRAGVPGL